MCIRDRDYTFDKDSTGNAGTFDYGNVILNYNTTTKKGTNQDITGGVISVKSAGATYEITFNCTLKNGNGIIGYYKGPLKYYDNTQGVSMAKSAVLKHKWWKRTIQQIFVFSLRIVVSRNIFRSPFR
eukprot:TRINITY_DN2051_c0_g1_i1.p3 TRINITY_DN2051_c0_g1~~TRINITY_DN2051_c0_g1_i1.p3  ORF type:complete len:127 (+),score=11.01 TRINITY_DN2051_c0_g1_i1:124-504(+)